MKKSHYRQSKEIPINAVKISSEFWKNRLKINNSTAIFYQWEQLENTHNQNNFRILAGETEGYRQGFFYCDSDLHKWADAASRVLTSIGNEKLSALVRDYIDLISKVQTSDGYLFTYNQFHFPNDRWTNMQIEHELYCFGHMIEAAVSYAETKEPDEYKKKFLDIAYKAADLLVKDFQNASSIYTPGHQEIEIALIRLYRLTNKKKYLDLASHFLYQRGKTIFFGLRLIGQSRNQNKRTNHIEKDMLAKEVENELQMRFFSGETEQQKEAPFLKLRSFFQYLTGRYHQQNKPIHKMKRPFGHAVRWGYLATAMAMLYQENGDARLLKALKRTWEHLIQKQMFVTGGIGSLGIVEGFGRDYELHSDYCYCETCAAIANILLNWEMTLITNEVKYSDLLEWQIYNAMSVGIALDGTTYLYRNLLESEGQLARKSWFATPCCPSNVSRILASLGKYLYSYNEENLWVHQYIGNKTQLTIGRNKIKLQMESELPWNGNIKLVIQNTIPKEFSLHLRIPSWTNKPLIKINEVIQEDLPEPIFDNKMTGSGLNPNSSAFYEITNIWDNQTVIEIDFPMEVIIHKTHPKVRANKSKIALSRGPLVYCVESIDNPEIQIPGSSINLNEEITHSFKKELLDGVVVLQAKNKLDQKLLAIPYYSWANREKSSMQVWFLS
jgi:DUF1680 family protein